MVRLLAWWPFRARSTRLICGGLLAAALALLPLGQACQAREIEWRMLETQHFVIRYSEKDRPTAVRAGEIAEKWYAILAGKLGSEPKAATLILLYPDRVSFSKATGVGRAESVVGLAQYGGREIALDGSGAFSDIAGILPHELVHVFLSAKLGPNIGSLPLWMHEGLAKYLSGEWSGADSVLLTDTATRMGFLSLDSISEAFPSDGHARAVAYVQSYSMVKFMVGRYGSNVIPKIVEDVSQGKAFDDALFSVTGVRQNQLQDDWLQHVTDRYRIGRLNRFLTGLGWAAVALLAILAFRARRIQKRRKMREFEEEEGQTP